MAEICTTCLSNDGTLSPISQEQLQILNKLCYPKTMCLNNRIVKLCWQCDSKMQDMNTFRTKALESLDYLAEHWKNSVQQRRPVLEISPLTRHMLQKYTVENRASNIKIEECREILEETEINIKCEDSLEERDALGDVKTEGTEAGSLGHASTDILSSSVVKIVLEPQSKGKESTSEVSDTYNDSLDAEAGEDPEENETTNKCVKAQWYTAKLDDEEILAVMEQNRQKPEFLEAKYKCQFCAIVFPDESMFHKHNNAFHDEGIGPFCCTICTSRFSGFNELSKHRTIHSTTAFFCTCGFKTYCKKDIITHGRSAGSVTEPSQAIAVKPFFQDSKSSDETQEIELPLKRKRQNCSWIFVKKYDNVIEAQEALSEENTWSVHYSSELEEGKKIYYSCKKVKKGWSQCPAKKYLLYDSTSNAVFMYKTDADHDHETKIPTIYGLPEAVKLEIDRLFALHLKPKSIMTALEKIEGIQMPKITQLRKYLSEQRRALYGNRTISLGELKRWLQANSVLPENPHDAFVIAYEIFEDDAPFRFVLSSKHLLELARDADVLHASATYKLTWQGYPVLIVGTTDKQHKFHPLCLSVSPAENKEDFQLIFKSMKEKIQSLFSSPFKPKILVADATSIQIAFTEVFKDSTVRICWVYAKKMIQSRIESDVKKSIQKQMLEDVDTLHSITSRDAFNTAGELFVQKYEEQIKFVKYFKEQWLVNKNWYLGAVPMSPSTNNALKKFNKLVIDSQTLRERLQLPRFLMLAKEMVNEWSTKNIKNRDENCIAKSPISLKEWTTAYNWAKLPYEILVIPRDDKNFTYYQIPGGEDYKCKVFENNPKTFDEFKEQFFGKWEVSLPKNKMEWIHGQCTCPEFFSMYMCKHIIGVSIRLKYTVPPAEAKNNALGRKRKRPKARRALIVP